MEVAIWRADYDDFLLRPLLIHPPLNSPCFCRTARPGNFWDAFMDLHKHRFRFVCS